jgi:hypothetical protein
VARLDGLPLAIELAAVRAEALGALPVLDRIDDRFALLTGGGDRLAPGRRRSLAATMEWSYLLLDEREQQVFRQVSVFPGPFTLEGAERLRRAANDGDLGADDEQLCLLLDPLLDLFDPPHNQPAGDVFGRAAPGEGDVIRFGDLRVGDMCSVPRGRECDISNRQGVRGGGWKSTENGRRVRAG